MKFEQLLQQVPSTGTTTLPRANRLPFSNVLITKDMGEGIITVYENGLYTYVKGKNTTVYAVDRCAHYVDPLDPYEKEIPYDKIAEMEWYIPLWMMGTSRIEKNNKRSEDDRIAFYLSNDGSDYSVFTPGIDEMLNEQEEIRSNEEKMNARKGAFSEVMKALSATQREALTETYFSNKSRTQIARERGCSQQAVSKNIDAALRKAKKEYSKRGIF